MDPVLKFIQVLILIRWRVRDALQAFMHLSFFVLLRQLPNCIQLDNDVDIKSNSVSYVPIYNDTITVTGIQVLYLNFSYVTGMN